MVIGLGGGGPSHPIQDLRVFKDSEEKFPYPRILYFVSDEAEKRFSHLTDISLTHRQKVLDADLVLIQPLHLDDIELDLILKNHRPAHHPDEVVLFETTSQ